MDKKGIEMNKKKIECNGCTAEVVIKKELVIRCSACGVGHLHYKEWESLYGVGPYSYSYPCSGCGRQLSVSGVKF